MTQEWISDFFFEGDNLSPMEFAQAGFVGLTEFAHSLIAYLPYTLALDVKILGNLCHRLVFLSDTEEGVDDLRLATVE